MSEAFVAVSLLLAAGLSLCMLLLLLKSTTLAGRHHKRFRQGARVGGFTGIGLVLLLTLSAAGISDGSALVMAIISSPLSVVIGFLSGWGAVGAARIFEVFSGAQLEIGEHEAAGLNRRQEKASRTSHLAMVA